MFAEIIIHQRSQIITIFVGWTDEIELPFFCFDGTDDVITHRIGAVTNARGFHQNAVVADASDKFEFIIPIINLFEIARIHSVVKVQTVKCSSKFWISQNPNLIEGVFAMIFVSVKIKLDFVSVDFDAVIVFQEIF